MKFGDRIFITDRCDFSPIRGKEGIFVCYHNEKNDLCKVVIKDEKDFFFLWKDEILLLE